jgi:aminoglycoside phosphotransferase family enzyme/predicted kinase
MSHENDGAELVRDLLRPEAYGDGRSEPVSLRTTHASWVFLAGDHAWKVKRPVNLGFLDFRTPEARRRACQDEVRLNRRLAPDIYLGVVPVLRTSHGYVFDANTDGQVVDWAVRMRRLPDESSAAALLARGELDSATLEVLAERLAVFFAGAPSTPQFGTPTVLCLNVTENFTEMAPFVGDLLDQETLDEVEAFQMSLLTQDVERFVARVSEDRIREGHGDLRLEHVYFVPIPGGKPRPTIIDCIEFNERFRCGDAAAEVAFLAMELEASGWPNLAAGFVARYAEASDDFGLYGVLDFYLSYRAWIRGKVAALVAADPTTSADLRALKRAEAARDFRLARSFGGEPLHRPCLIAVGGVIGSGKSTLAAALGRELALPVIGSDRTRKLTAGLAPTARGGVDLYDREQTERTYAEIIRRATEVLTSGRGAILDATFSAHRWRQAAAAAAQATNANFVFIEATCADPATLRARLASRRGSASISDATDEQLNEFLRRYEPLGSSDPGPSFSIETSGSPSASLQAALRLLQGTGIVLADPPQLLREPAFQW